MLTQEIVAKLIADNQQFNKAMNSSVAVMDKLNSKGQKVGSVVTEMAKNIDGTVKVIRKLDNDGKVLSERFVTVAKSADEVSRALKKIAVEEEKIKSEKAKEFAKAFSELATAAAASIFVVEKVGSAIKSAYDAAADGAKIMAAEQFFANAGKSLNAYRTATKGLVSDANLMKKANMADSMGIDQDTFMALSKVAQAAALKTGQDFEYMFDSIIVGTARSSRLLLDNLGIIVSVEQANEKYAKALGKTVEALTDEEKATAFAMEVREKSKGQLDEYAKVLDKTAEAYSRLDAQSENFWNNLKKSLASSGSGVATFFGDLLEQLNKTVNAQGWSTLLKQLAAVTGAALSGNAAMAVMGSAEVSPRLKALQEERTSAIKTKKEDDESRPAKPVLDAISAFERFRVTPLAESLQITSTNITQLSQSVVDMESILDAKATGVGVSGQRLQASLEALKFYIEKIVKYKPGGFMEGGEKKKDKKGGKGEKGEKGGKEDGPPKTRNYDNPSESEFRKIKKSIEDASDKMFEDEISNNAAVGELRLSQASRQAKSEEMYAAAIESARKDRESAEKELMSTVAKSMHYWASEAESWVDALFSKSPVAILEKIGETIKDVLVNNFSKAATDSISDGLKNTFSSGAQGVAQKATETTSGVVQGAAAGSAAGPWGALIGAIIALVVKLLSSLEPIVVLINALADGLSAFAKEALGGLLEPLKKLAGPLFSILVSLGKLLGALLKPLIPLVEFAVAIVAIVVEFVAGIITALSPLASVVMMLISPLMYFVTLMAQALFPAIGTISQKIIWASVAINNAIVGFMRGMFIGLDNFLTSIKLPDVVPEAWKNFGNMMKEEDFRVPSDYTDRKDAEDDNTDALKENTAAIRDFQREFRNLPSGFKVNAAMYRASNGVGPKGKTPYAPKDEMGEYTPPPRGKVNAEAAREIRRAKEEAARNPNRIEM